MAPSLLAWGGMLAAALLAGGAAWLLLRALGLVAARTEGEFDDTLASIMHAPLSALIAVVAAGAALVPLAGRLTAAELAWTRRSVYAAFLVAAGWAFVRVVRVFLDAEGQRHRRLLPAARTGRRLVAVAVYALVFVLVLDQYHLSVTPILTGLGIAGVAAALALQDTLGNFFAGLSIQTGQALQPGHYVRDEDGELEGYVADVGWRTTTLRTLGGNLVVIPNAQLAKSKVTDYDLPRKDMSIVLEFLTGEEADPKRVIEVLVEEAKKAQAENKGIAPDTPFAQYVGIAEYALKFSLIVRITEFVQQFQVKHDVGQRVLARFRAEGIRVPYPTRHNYQEPVKPEARRVPGAPGGLAPKKRPPRPKREHGQVLDPRQAEAATARREIAAEQRRKGNA